MGIREIRTSPKFERQYRKLSEGVKTKAQTKEIIFRANPFDPRLETHKLHGREKEVWAFSVTHRYRIKFLFLPAGSVLFSRNFRDRREREVGEDPVPPELMRCASTEAVSRKHGIAHSNLIPVLPGFGMVR